jgi:transposase
LHLCDANIAPGVTRPAAIATPHPAPDEPVGAVSAGHAGPAPAPSIPRTALARRPRLGRPARKSITRTAAFLEREADRLQGQADALIAASAALAAARDLLRGIPGVGAVTAAAPLAELPEPARFASAQQAAAYPGLAPREYRSGSRVRRRTRLSKAGNARLRKALDLPTLTAIRFNPLLRRSFERLVAAGKARMAAVGACMRKLLMIAYGVLKNRTPFDPAWAMKPPS